MDTYLVFFFFLGWGIIILYITIFILFIRMMLDVRKIRNQLLYPSNKNDEYGNPFISYSKIKTMVLCGKTDLAYELIIKKECYLLNDLILRHNLKEGSRSKYMRMGDDIINEYSEYFYIIDKKIPSELLTFDNYLSYFYNY